MNFSVLAEFLQIEPHLIDWLQRLKIIFLDVIIEKVVFLNLCDKVETRTLNF